MKGPLSAPWPEVLINRDQAVGVRRTRSTVKKISAVQIQPNVIIVWASSGSL